MTTEQMAEIYEAIEILEYAPIYAAVLKKTGDKQQALDAAKYCRDIADEMEVKNAS